MHHRPGQFPSSLVASIAVHGSVLFLLVTLPDAPTTRPTLIIPTLHLKSPPTAPETPVQAPSQNPAPEEPAPPPPPTPPPEPPPMVEPKIPEKPPDPKPFVSLPKEQPPAPRPEPKESAPVPAKKNQPSPPQNAPALDPSPRSPSRSASASPIANIGARARPFLAPNPPYPMSARRDGAEGEVLVAASIDPDGLVTAASVSRSSGRDDLDDAATDTVLRRWRFRPATRAGKPVPSRETVLVRFVLEE